MGLRGSKPRVDRTILWGNASRWARFLFALRDGEPGAIFNLEWGPREPVVYLGKKGRRRLLRAISPAVVLKAGDDWSKLIGGDETHLMEPVAARSDLWEGLCSSDSERDIIRIAAEIRRWVKDQRPRLVGADLFPDLLILYRKQIIQARRLRNYPRTDRSGSDDKRVEFFAKILAGLQVGLTAITAFQFQYRDHFPKEEPSREEVIALLQCSLAPLDFEADEDQPNSASIATSPALEWAQVSARTRLENALRGGENKRTEK